MLSALAACGALTGLIAGIAGAWSPCGLSMIDTIGSALGNTRRLMIALALATFGLGCVLGAILTFGLLAFLGTLLGHGAVELRAGLGGGIALLAALADWRGVRIAPQIRRQVPERWRWIMPLPLACALYGVLLGLGFTTFVLAFAVWALAALSFAASSVTVGLAIGVGFGLGRAIPIVWLAPGLRSERGTRRLEQIALEPRLWLGMRRLGALGLTLCAVAIAATPAFGDQPPPARIVASGATDPSSNGIELAWQTVGGSGMIEAPDGTQRLLPGNLPALGDTHIAWVSGTAIVVADSTTLAPELTVSLPTGASVSTLAVSDSYLVANVLPSAGGDELLAYPLANPALPTTIATATLGGAIGRPTLEGTDVVFASGSTAGSAVDEVDLTTGAKTVLRSARANDSLENPVLTGNRLVYEQIDRCAQEVWLAPVRGNGARRLLLTLPSTVVRDPGYQHGYVRDYDRASHCPNRGPGAGGRLTIGTTATSSSTVYVTEYPAHASESKIIALPLHG